MENIKDFEGLNRKLKEHEETIKSLQNEVQELKKYIDSVYTVHKSDVNDLRRRVYIYKKPITRLVKIYRKKGMTIKELAEKFECSESTIKRRLKE